MSFKIAILRGFGQKPLLRWVSMQGNGLCIVRSEQSYREWLDGRGGRSWIGWPQGEPVFEYNDSTFSRLEALYSQGALAELQKEWEHCHPFTGN